MAASTAVQQRIANQRGGTQSLVVASNWADTVAAVQHELEDMPMDSEPPEAADEHKGIQGKQQLEEGSQLEPWVAGSCIAASLSE